MNAIAKRSFLDLLDAMNVYTKQRNSFAGAAEDMPVTTIFMVYASQDASPVS